MILIRIDGSVTVLPDVIVTTKVESGLSLLKRFTGKGDGSSISSQRFRLKKVELLQSYNYSKLTPSQRVKHSWNKWKKAKVGENIVKAYNNAHPAMKTSVAVASALTIGPLSAVTVETSVGYAIRNPETTIQVINGYTKRTPNVNNRTEVIVSVIKQLLE